MKSYFTVLALGLLFGKATSFGQINLTKMETASTDSIQKSKIRYFSSGNGGRNKVWNFTNKLGSKKSSQVMFVKDSIDLLTVIEPDKICYYRTTPDTFLLLGSESPLEKRKYLLGKIAKLFPAEYGDSISNEYRCEGMYCGDHPFREVGMICIKADADGSIVLAEDDTIKNVLRVHTIDAYSICMDIDSTALDTAKLTQVIDEHYGWYLPKSDYPIIETVTSTTFDNMNVLGTTKYAYCNLPKDLVNYYITSDDEHETDEQDSSYDGGEQQIPDIMHYRVEIQGKIIQIQYSLDEGADITTIVANQMGMLCTSRHWTQEAGQEYSIKLDCTGLRSGIYILYINVNGKVYNEKVSL